MTNAKENSSKKNKAMKYQDGTKLAAAPEKRCMIKNKVYKKELFRLQLELVKLQRWVVHEGLRVVVIFEGPGCRWQGRRHQADH